LPKYSGAVIVLLVSLGPTGGADSNANEISLSRNMISKLGAIYIFFSMVLFDNYFG
jgi:hypothetical protein